MNLVVFKVNHLGDNVVFVPVIQTLRRKFPDWHVTVVTTPNEAELYRGPSGPQERLLTPKPDFNKSFRLPWRLAWWTWRIRRLGPDACLLPFDQGNAAHFVAKHSGARVRAGSLQNIRLRGSLTDEVRVPADGSPVTWNWEIARALAGAFGLGARWPLESPPPDLGHLPSAGAAPKGDRKRVVVHAGASRSLNQWPRSQFASVAGSLARDHEVVWIIHGDSTGPAPDGTVGAPVGSLAELAAWLSSAELFLGNNSGPMHLANALGCPGVAVTGPSAMGWNPHWHRDRWTVLRHPSLACAPCERLNKELEGCANRESPMACLSHWTVERVEAACRSRLSGGGGLPS
jgi:ADP-heptose:LPS heptosyltransferase